MNAEIKLKKGNLLYNLNKFDSALKIYNYALELDPNNKEI